jgi:hypothetical protein
MPQSSNAPQPSPDWHWARVYYFESRKDDLILDGVWPALEATTRGGRCQALFQRDWVGGPNVLLGFGLGRAAAAAMEEATDSIRRYLREHPSTTELEPNTWASSIRTLAELERRPEQADRMLQPNNTVLTACPEPVSPLLQDRALRHEIRSRLCQSSAIVVSWLHLMRSQHRDRGELALQALVTMVWVASPDRLSAAASFYSHATGFLTYADRNGQLQRQFEARYRGAAGEHARQIVEATTQDLACSTGSALHLMAFAEWLRSTLVDLHEALERQSFAPHPHLKRDTSGTQTKRLDPTAIVALLNRSPTFRAWQITVNLVYLMLNQLGIQPVQRYLACYLLFRAVDDLFGLPAEAMAGELLRTGDTTVMLPIFASASHSATHAVPNDPPRP